MLTKKHWRRKLKIWLPVGVGLVGFFIILRQLSGAPERARAPHLTTPTPSPVIVRGITRETNFYQQSILQPLPTKTTPPSTILHQIHTVIIPHHLLADDLINEALSNLSHLPIKHVLLISPDHFYQTPTGKLGIMADFDWATPFGTQTNWNLEATTQAQLANLGIDFTNQSAFQLEHGIYGLVPFIKHYFPQTQLNALILSPVNYNQTIPDLPQLITTFQQILYQQNITMAETLLIVSSDFVHAATANYAQIQDQHNQELLAELSLANHQAVENDCRQCWPFALTWAAIAFPHNNNHFFFLNNNNSAHYGGPPVNVTSYITGYFYSTEPSKSSESELD